MTTLLTTLLELGPEVYRKSPTYEFNKIRDLAGKYLREPNTTTKEAYTKFIAACKRRMGDNFDLGFCRDRFRDRAAAYRKPEPGSEEEKSFVNNRNAIAAKNKLYSKKLRPAKKVTQPTPQSGEAGLDKRLKGMARVYAQAVADGKLTQEKALKFYTVRAKALLDEYIQKSFDAATGLNVPSAAVQKRKQA